jgi:hypothetical protein
MTIFKRLKTLGFALLTATSLWMAPAQAAGTLPLAMAQQIDINGQPLAGCIVSFFVAGTVASPQNSFSDFGLSQNPNNVLNCDQTGRVPMFWLADGLVHVRLTDSSGLQIIDTTMQVLGPSSGGGGGGTTVDPTTIAATGDLKWRLDKTPIAGWVRANGLTIGSSTSGASERANADTQSLFVYIWTTFSQPSANTICPVVGGLGANALADFTANKQITVQDARARAVMTFDDMGNSAAGGYAGIPFVQGGPTQAGSFGGLNLTTLLTTNLPSQTPSGTLNIQGTVPMAAPTNYTNTFAGGGQGIEVSGAGSTPFTITLQSFLGTPFPGQNSTPFPSVPRFLLGTLYWKL